MKSNNLKYYLETFGCQMNASDSEIIRGELEEAGYAATDSPGDADILLLNTCTVRNHAEVRAIGRLTDLYRHKKAKRVKCIGLLGCIAQQYGERISSIAPWIDLVLGTDNYRELPRILDEFFRGPGEVYRNVRLNRGEMYDGITPRRESRTSAWVPVMRGCDRFCTYCIVPYVRGRERSRNVDDILESVLAIADQGIPEIVLLGQNVNAYQWNSIDFPELLRRISRIQGIRRIRFITSHPLKITGELIGVMKDHPQICNSLHLPLQSGSDRILKAMNRGYTMGQYLEKIDRLRHEIPGISISTDLMVGFPGETEDDYAQTIRVTKDIEFDDAYMYMFSRREGTRAANYPDQIDTETASRRLSELIEIQKEIKVRKNRTLTGSVLTVLVEDVAKKGENMYLARTESNKMVVFRGNGDCVGSLLRIRITDSKGATLIGELEDVETGRNNPCLR